MAESIQLPAERGCQTFSVVMASGATMSGAIDVRGYRAGMVYLPAAFNGIVMGIHVSDTETGTYGLPNLDASTAAYTFTAPGAPSWNILPTDLVQPAAFIKINSATATAAAATITGVLKAF